MAQPTSGMKLQQSAVEQAILGMQGDLLAISLLRETARRSDVDFQSRKRLWNALSRLTTRVAFSLGATDINSQQHALARELTGWASRGI